jgi:hypothetical protein
VPNTDTCQLRLTSPGTPPALAWFVSRRLTVARTEPTLAVTDPQDVVSGPLVTCRAQLSGAVAAGTLFRFVLEPAAGPAAPLDSGWLASPNYVFGRVEPGEYALSAVADPGAGAPWTTEATVQVAYLDTDHDFLPDPWEVANFGQIGFADGDADPNGDGLTVAGEYAAQSPPYSFTLCLRPGWNLFSLPGRISPETLDLIRRQAFSGPWCWRNGAYAAPAPVPEPGTGLWLYANEDPAPVTITGTPPANRTARLARGEWLLAGPATRVRVPAAPGLYVFAWQDGRFRRLEFSLPGADTMEPLRAYWLYTTDAEALVPVW